MATIRMTNYGTKSGSMQAVQLKNYIELFGLPSCGFYNHFHTQLWPTNQRSAVIAQQTIPKNPVAQFYPTEFNYRVPRYQLSLGHA